MSVDSHCVYHFGAVIKQHRKAYEKMIKEKSPILLRLIRLNCIGLPRSGKTSFRRRLMGEIINILMALERGEKDQPSTGVAEQGGHVFIKSMTTNMGTIQGRLWSILKDIKDEASMLNEFFYLVAHEKTLQVPSEGATLKELAGTDPSTPDTSPGGASTSQKVSIAEKFVSSLKNLFTRSSKSDLKETFSIINEVMEGDDWDQVKYVLDDLVFLINTDTGGQAEFLDLHGALVQGPSFNLLFTRLTDNLDSLFSVYYTNEKGVSTEKEDSTMTVEEVLFQALASIACFGGFFCEGDIEPARKAEISKPLDLLHTDSQSIAMVVGTHFDKVTKEEFEAKDKSLQEKIQRTEFFDKGIIQHAKQDQLMLAVNNMSGGQKEIDEIRRVLEKVIERNFKQKNPYSREMAYA